MTDLARRLLPMANHVRGKRSAVTCHLKCADACTGETCNQTQNPYFRDIVGAQLTRRAAVGLGLAGAVSLTWAGSQQQAQAAQLGTADGAGAGLSFTAIPPVAADVDALTVPDGFAWIPLIRWGDPLFADSVPFDIQNQTEASQAGQFGYNNDYTDILRIDESSALLFVNHEYTNEGIMFPLTQITREAERVRAVGRAAHGLTVVELTRERVAAPWSYVQGGARNRRFLIDTPYRVTGPAAGSTLMTTVADPTGMTVLGTLGNCAGGTTPWGTILSGEENFNGYFRSTATAAEEKRYGFSDAATTRLWELDDPRFDTRNAGYENEINRFGWIVEVDPFDPASTPVKHTALGRLKHEGANVQVAANGRVVAYMGDDEKFDYLYKFVSAGSYVEGDRAHNKTLLESGDLYVARFTGTSADIDGSGALPADGAFDGAGEWIPLTQGGASAIAGMTIEQVLVHTRLAADIAGATKMDRCEDVEPNPVNGRIYVACTNNSDRGVGGKAVADEANPRTENRDGHIVEIEEAGGDHTATTFAWNLLMLCGDVAQGDTVYFSGYPAEQVSPISCPDNVAFDTEGNLWISTDGAPAGIGYADGLFRVRLEGAERGRVEQFLAVPKEGETCGPLVHDEEMHVFVAVQHPGENGSFEAQSSLWPDNAAMAAAGLTGTVAAPRPSIVQVLRQEELVTPTPTPEPTPEPTPTDTPVPTDTATPTASPTPTPTVIGGGDVPGTSGGGAGSGSGGTLPQTGVGGLGALAGGAAALLAVGAGLLSRRKGGAADAAEGDASEA